MSQWHTDEPPRDGTIIYRRFVAPFRYLEYKPNSEQFRKGIKGRWQTMNESGQWENFAGLLTEEWTAEQPRVEAIGVPSPPL